MIRSYEIYFYFYSSKLDFPLPTSSLSTDNIFDPIRYLLSSSSSDDEMSIDLTQMFNENFGNASDQSATEDQDSISAISFVDVSDQSLRSSSENLDVPSSSGPFQVFNRRQTSDSDESYYEDCENPIEALRRKYLERFTDLFKILDLLLSQILQVFRDLISELNARENQSKH